MGSKNCGDPPPFLSEECFQGRVIEGLSYWQVFSALEWLSRRTSESGSGGLSVFVGYVKGEVGGARVLKLVYSSYEPYASRALDAIAKSYSDSPNVYGVLILHTTGEVYPGYPTLLVAVSGRTRRDSLDLMREVIERAKSEPPIFKLEVREDGEYWILGDGKRIPRARRDKA